MYLLLSLALLAVITVPATSRSVPTAIVSATTRRATTIATYFGEKARKLAQEQKESPDFALETFEPEFCPLLSLRAFGDYYSYEEDVDEALTDGNLDFLFGAMVPEDYYDDDGDEADEGFEDFMDFMDSCYVDCNVAEENIVTTCKFTGQQVCDDQGEFCIDDMVVTAIVPFDFSDISGKICMTYTTVPADLLELQGKEGCISMTIEMDLAATLALAFDADADPEDFSDAMEINKCGFTLGDEVCECSVCDNGLGGDLSCPDIGIISEDCAAFIDGITDLDSASEIGDVTSSVVRFTRIESEGEGGLRR